MDDTHSTRSHYVGIALRNDEYARLIADVKQFGGSHADALRRQCPEFFVETEVKKGRRTGISPFRLSR